MNVFQQLSDWYMSQCDGDWEHSYGVVIETLDNPGWRIKIDLAETRLSGRFFDAVQINNSETDWIVVEIQEDAFIGHGDPSKLEKIVQIFVKWASADPNWLLAAEPLSEAEKE